MSGLRLAVIGAGHLGRIHAKLAQANDQFQLVGVVDPSPEARLQVSQQLSVDTFESFKQVINHVDAAVVASPTASHYEVTSTLLRAGIHTLVEKPLALSFDQADRLVQIARNHHCVLQTGHVERFNPSWTTVTPHLGTPKYIEAVRAGAYSGRSTDIGVVMDLMIHDLDLILSLDHSPLQQIQASGLALLGSHEDLAEARLQFASGLVATLRVSRLATAATRRMQLYTSNAFADIDFSDSRVQIIRPSADIMDRSVALDELTTAQRMSMKERIFPELFEQVELTAPNRNAILDEHNDFALSILSGASPAVSGEDGARAVQVAGQIVEQIAQHAWDGQGSKPWRIGAQALVQPHILPLPQTAAEREPTPSMMPTGEDQINSPQRRAG